MRKVELLAPAGSMEALYAAVQNGCDAVYLGGHQFNARVYSDNFDYERMSEAIRYAHSYGVKVYVTMNTLLYENEIEDAIAYARFLYEQGADALIIQDLGLFDVVSQCFPDMECHASTQLHIHNEAGIRKMAELGFSRIVLPRETLIEDIERYAKSGIELEVFVQGAICVSYSGQCLMSAKKQNRSGNRGACAQMCRMKYRLGYEQDHTVHYVKQEGDYLISPKDLNTLQQVPKLIAAGVTSFKIEGRMKRPEYVALMTALYRKAIDAYYQDTALDYHHATKEMCKVFNRGFTSGLMFHQHDKAFINHERPNHIGIPVGKVLARKQNRVSIQLSAPLYQHDGIRFITDKEDVGCMVNKLYYNQLLVNHGEAGSVVEVEVDGYVPKHSRVVKTSDKIQLEELRKSYERGERRVGVVMNIELRMNQPALLRVSDDLGHTCEVFSDALVEEALKTPLSKERIYQQLSKTKDTIFYCESIHINADDNSTMPIKELNAMRRTALSKLYEQRIACPRRIVSSYQRQPSCAPISGLFVKVINEVQLKAAAAFPAQLYAEPLLFERMKKSYDELGCYGKRVMKEAYPKVPIMACEISGCMENDSIAEHFMNCTNSYAAAFLFSLGVKAIILSNECSREQAETLKQAFYKRYHQKGAFITYGYGREELMLSEYCVIHTCYQETKKPCGLCHKHSYFLEDMKKRRYPLYGDADCRIHLLDNEVFELSESASAIFLNFHTETADEVQRVLQHALTLIKKSEKEANEIQEA